MMKGRTKKMCGHGVSVNLGSEDCSLHIVCDFLFYGYHCTKRENITLHCPNSNEIWPTNDRTYQSRFHTSLKCTSLNSL